MCVDEFSDSLLELLDALEDATFQSLSRELCKETFNYVEPRAAGRYEVKVESLVPLLPGRDLRMLMGGVVVHNQMNIQFRGSFLVDEVEELNPLLVAVFVHTGRDYFAFGHIDSGEEGRRSIALVIMCHGAATAFLYRQLRLRAVQSLNRGFLVGAEHQRMFRRIEVQPHNIAQLLLEIGIIAYLERLHEMGLQVVCPQHAEYEILAYAHGFCQETRRPVGSIFRLLVLDFLYNEALIFLALGRMATTARQVLLESRCATIEEPSAPAPNRAFHYTEGRSYFLILLSVGRQQHYLGSLYHTHGRASASGPLYERFTFFITEVYLGGDAH